MRIGRWSELSVDRVCQEHEVMREVDANDFDSCITATLTLILCNTTPSSVSLLPIPLALNCRTLNVLS